MAGVVTGSAVSKARVIGGAGTSTGRPFGFAELAKVLRAGRDQRIVRRPRPRGDGVGAPVISLGRVELTAALVRHGEIVQGVGEIEMVGPQRGFLRAGGLTEHAGGGGEVAAHGRLLGGVEECSKADRIGHGTTVLQPRRIPDRLYSAAFFADLRPGDPWPCRLRHRRPPFPHGAPPSNVSSARILPCAARRSWTAAAGSPIWAPQTPAAFAAPARELRERRRQGGQFFLKLLISLGRALAGQRLQLLSTETRSRLHRLRGPPLWRGHAAVHRANVARKAVRNTSAIRYLLIPLQIGGHTGISLQGAR